MCCLWETEAQLAHMSVSTVSPGRAGTQRRYSLAGWPIGRSLLHLKRKIRLHDWFSKVKGEYMMGDAAGSIPVPGGVSQLLFVARGVARLR
ncbi:hypothetical protein E2C01_070881 [Portunus trituberculatus]|uniref:Uncharacterized protein n=1 Tax=Portunus trituberculatus TaxID=210409 RepID=A0A5B7I6I7_PORTR|nr:hypothetical protein [Portunus trituberculatus]